MSEKTRGKYSRTYKHVATGTVSQLVTENPKRVAVLVYNNGDQTVYILSAQNLGILDGIPVAAGNSYENDTSTATLWVIAAGGRQDLRVQVDGN